MFGVQESQPVVLESEMNDEQFFRFCVINRDLRIERSARGQVIIMAPLGGSSSSGEIKLSQIFGNWAERDGRGRVFGSTAGFTLPNGAMRSPDISWVRNERLEELTDEQWEKFLPLCPDFVLELRSPSDSMRTLREKMQEYMENGSELGWLLDPERKQLLIYRPGAVPEMIENPGEISGEPVLRGFTLDVRQIWRAMEKR